MPQEKILKITERFTLKTLADVDKLTDEISDSWRDSKFVKFGFVRDFGDASYDFPALRLPSEVPKLRIHFESDDGCTVDIGDKLGERFYTAATCVSGWARVLKREEIDPGINIKRISLQRIGPNDSRQDMYIFNFAY